MSHIWEEKQVRDMTASFGSGTGLRPIWLCGRCGSILNKYDDNKPDPNYPLRIIEDIYIRNDLPMRQLSCDEYIAQKIMES